MNYRRSFEELDQKAAKFWPREISEREAELSTLPLLLQTQEQFISILKIETDAIDDIFAIIEKASLRANLFLKHLALLADFGGESLNRVSREFRTLFPTGTLSYNWNEQIRVYEFRRLPATMTNTTLKLDGRRLIEKGDLSDLQRDAIAILMFGSAYSDPDSETGRRLAKCQIGDFLGKPDELEAFIRQRYIWVSRIMEGAKSNTQGQLAQQFVKKFIEENINLPSIQVTTTGRLDGVTHTDATTGRDTSFDLVVTNGKQSVAIEVSFQVTTNSVIERKSAQARGRFEQVEKAGHKIAYVIDGAGNFQRQTALRVICSYSHCTVAFTIDELNVLCNFLREEFSAH